MIKKQALTLVGTLAFILIGAVTAHAQDCGVDTTLTVQEVVDNVEASCCSASSDTRKRRCIRRATQTIRRTRRSLTQATIASIVAALDTLRTNACGTTDTVLACTEETARSLTETVDSISERCCDKNFRGARRSCLTSSRQELRRARRFIGSDQFNTIRDEIRTLTNDEQCGSGGRRSSCDVTRASSDGQGGYVHKPVSDSTGSIVNLLPSSDDASSCRYESASGRVVRQAFTSGRTNGFRETWRPVGGGSCTSFPRNMRFSCQIGRRRVCYRIDNPCERDD